LLCAGVFLQLEQVVLFFNTNDFAPAIVLCDFLKAPRQSSTFLFIAAHGCIQVPALSWPMTGHAKRFAAALEVLHPLKFLSQNMQRAFLASPFLGSVLFVTVKYCQT
jgi:hypothetical protein